MKKIAGIVVCTTSAALFGCASPPAFVSADFYYAPGVTCALLATPEQEVAIIPIQEFKDVFPETDGDEAVARLMGEAVLARLASRTGCFQDQQHVVTLDDLSIGNTRKFEAYIGSSPIRVNVLDRPVNALENPAVSLVVILNNITFEYAGRHSFVPASDPSHGLGANYYSRELGVQFDYALQATNSWEVIGYGSVSTSKAGAFVSKERRWLGLIESSADQLLKQLKLPGEPQQL